MPDRAKLQEEMLANAFHSALKNNDPHSYIGDLEFGGTVVIDGRFDLFAVAKSVMLMMKDAAPLV